MDTYLKRLHHWLWAHGSQAQPPSLAIRLGRYLFVLGRDLIEGQLTMRAMSLVYTTLLSIVPLLALSFSVLKALGAHNALEPILLEFLHPLGSQANEITATVIGFVENIRVGVLGSLGVALLFWTALSLIQKVEGTFNFIWRIERPRPLAQRMGEYFAMLTVGPVIVFSALGLTASVLNSSVMTQISEIQPFGMLIYTATKLIPYVLIVGMFTFLYRFIPNTPVKLGAAAIGGLISGLLWQSASLAFASFAAGSTNYNAIYSGFAIMIFLLIWLYVGWMILLIGCQLAFYIQHPEHLTPRKTPADLSSRGMEFLALAIMHASGQRFIAQQPGYTQDELALLLNAEPEHVGRVVAHLLYHGLLLETGQNRTQLIPGVDLASLRMTQLWQLARAGAGANPRTHGAIKAQVNDLLDHAEQAFTTQLGETSLRQWIMQKAPASTRAAQ
ncbi:YihY/virulence factor BrkB family protein [Sinimarinibacterium sp. NLF-5-8]|uniref:YihY/virulence factor BrkB family protein n=1 Tax=Sinimarinibacterium sp. NLF-5-8 TaxID=2698684 RepID=UPI00137BA417|nr:YihY/virulence factor BrkB family protein [Sinimarinibacterium sp. NLF-5-8]QHS10105.1 YihY/virulence factor BrkB family protein [Sinimarinibacterium sp. NLF-5-8]